MVWPSRTRSESQPAEWAPSPFKAWLLSQEELEDLMLCPLRLCSASQEEDLRDVDLRLCPLTEWSASKAEFLADKELTLLPLMKWSASAEDLDDETSEDSTSRPFTEREDEADEDEEEKEVDLASEPPLPRREITYKQYICTLTQLQHGGIINVHKIYQIENHITNLLEGFWTVFCVIKRLNKTPLVPDLKKKTS